MYSATMMKVWIGTMMLLLCVNCEGRGVDRSHTGVGSVELKGSRAVRVRAARWVRTLHISEFRYDVLVEEWERCGGYVNGTRVWIVVDGTRDVPLTWSGGSASDVTYYFNASVGLDLKFEVRNLPEDCEVRVRYQLLGYRLGGVTTEAVPAFIGVTPSVMGAGNGVRGELLFADVGGVPPGRTYEMEALGGDGARVWSGMLNATTAGVGKAVGRVWTATMPYAGLEGTYTLRMRIGGRFRRVALLEVPGESVYLVQPRGFDRESRGLVSLQFFGTQLNTMPGGDRAQVVAFRLQCGTSQPVRETDDLGPDDSASTSMSVWNVSLPFDSILLSVCYRKEGGLWRRPRIFYPTAALDVSALDEMVPVADVPNDDDDDDDHDDDDHNENGHDDNGDHDNDAGEDDESGGDAGESTGCAIARPEECGALVDGVTEVLVTVEGTELPGQFLERLAELMCVDVSAVTLEVRDGITPVEVSVRVDCTGMPECNVATAIGALMCYAEGASSGDGGEGSALLSELGVVSVGAMFDVIGGGSLNAGEGMRLGTILIIAGGSALLVLLLVGTAVGVAMWLRRSRREGNGPVVGVVLEDSDETKDVMMKEVETKEVDVKLVDPY